MTTEEKIKVIKKKGQILTFLRPVKWKGENYTQIMTNGIEKSQGSVKLLGTLLDSPWMKSLEELSSLIDWEDYKARKAFSK